MMATLVSFAAAKPIDTRAACSDLTVVFARGTTETGDLGSLVGPPFQTALKSAMGTATVSMVGVPSPDYPATVAEFLAGGSATGTTKMAALVTSALAACPNTKMVIAGYRYDPVLLSFSLNNGF
jgi:cutinase